MWLAGAESPTDSEKQARQRKLDEVRKTLILTSAPPNRRLNLTQVLTQASPNPVAVQAQEGR